MDPINTNTKKAKATPCLSSAQRGVSKRSLDKKNVPSGDTDEGPDRISSLPQSILCCILTLLSVTESTRMARQSKAWRGAFRSLEYDLEIINEADLWRGERRPRSRLGYFSQSAWRSSVISSLLDTRHRHSIRRFIIQRTLVSSEAMSEWLCELSQTGIIEELVLEMPLRDPVRLSHSLFNCITLRSLSLSNCHWPRDDVPTIYSEWTLPLLTELTLSYMNMTADAIIDLLERCPALLSLSLGNTWRDMELEIQCKNLLSLTKVGPWRRAVQVLEAPKLERLLWWPLAPRLTFESSAHAQWMHTIGVFQHCPFQDGVVLEQVRTIALFTNVDNLYRTIKTLNHLPHLETTPHIKMKDGSDCDNNKSKSISFEEHFGSPFTCLENSVKTIVLRVNNMVRQKLSFANYLLGAAKSLKTMIIFKKRMAGELLPPES